MKNLLLMTLVCLGLGAELVACGCMGNRKAQTTTVNSAAGKTRTN